MKQPPAHPAIQSGALPRPRACHAAISSGARLLRHSRSFRQFRPVRPIVTLENFARREQRIERRRKTRIQRHLHEHLDDLLARAADVQRRLDMHLQLRLRTAERGQRRDRCNFPRAQIELRPAVNIAEAEFEQQTSEIRRDRRERGDHLFAGRAVDFLEFVPASGVAVVFCVFHGESFSECEGD